MSIRHTTYLSPIGLLTLCSDEVALTGLWIEGQRYFGSKILNLDEFDSNEASLPIFAKTFHWLDQYFKGENPNIHDLLLSPQGTDFQRSVWNLLCKIPYGATTSYGAIAKQLHSSARAVGAAVGRNPISIIIPCHRVIGANGQLTGFAGGLDRKVWLLEHEKRGQSPSRNRYFNDN